MKKKIIYKELAKILRRPKLAAARTLEELPDNANFILGASSDHVFVSFSTGNGDAQLEGRGRDCGGVRLLEVKKTAAPSGWGPLMYDIAIELATHVSDGLISD